MSAAFEILSVALEEAIHDAKSDKKFIECHELSTELNNSEKYSSVKNEQDRRFQIASVG